MAEIERYQGVDAALVIRSLFMATGNLTS